MNRRTFGIALAVLLCGALLSASEPGLYSPNVYRGETFSRVLTWQDSAGNLVNLTSYTAKLEIRDASTNAVLDTFTESAGLTLGGAAGTITWAMTAAETLALPVGNHVYDLRMTSSTSVVTYLVYGHVNVHETRTR